MGVISVLGDPEKHFWLTRSVARAMGVSLSGAMAAGRLTAQEYAQLVTRCRACQRVSECEAWLGNPAAIGGQAPECCMHKDVFEPLAHRY